MRQDPPALDNPDTWTVLRDKHRNPDRLGLISVQ
jgi:hypothetical protein